MDVAIPYVKLKKSNVGRFSKAEDQVIEKHVKLFLAEKDISEASYKNFLVESNRDKSDKKLYAGLWGYVGQFFPERDTLSVMVRGERLFHPFRFKGAFTEEEDAALYKYYALWGPKWARIGRQIGRRREACKDRYRHCEMKKKQESAVELVWTVEKDKLLSDLILAKMEWQIGDKFPVWGIPWKEIAEQLGLKCPTEKIVDRWTFHLHPKLGGYSGLKWVDKDYIEVIQAILNGGAKSFDQVRWRQLDIRFHPTLAQMKIKRRLDSENIRHMGFRKRLRYLRTLYRTLDEPDVKEMLRKPSKSRKPKLVKVLSVVEYVRLFAAIRGTGATSAAEIQLQLDHLPHPPMVHFEAVAKLRHVSHLAFQEQLLSLEDFYHTKLEEINERVAAYRQTLEYKARQELSKKPSPSWEYQDYVELISAVKVFKAKEVDEVPWDMLPLTNDARNSREIFLRLVKRRGIDDRSFAKQVAYLAADYCDDYEEAVLPDSTSEPPAEPVIHQVKIKNKNKSNDKQKERVKKKSSLETEEQLSISEEQSKRRLPKTSAENEISHKKIKIAAKEIGHKQNKRGKVVDENDALGIEHKRNSTNHKRKRINIDENLAIENETKQKRKKKKKKKS